MGFDTIEINLVWGYYVRLCWGWVWVVTILSCECHKIGSKDVAVTFLPWGEILHTW